MNPDRFSNSLSIRGRSIFINGGSVKGTLVRYKTEDPILLSYKEDRRTIKRVEYPDEPVLECLFEVGS